MKTARIVLLFIIVTAVLIGGYFGANMYMQNMAIKKINNVIKKNHWENLVEYGNVKANILSGSVTVNNVAFTIQDKLKSKTIGVINFKKIVLKGNMNKNYSISGDDIKYINLNPEFPETLANKALFNAKSFKFDIHKTSDIIDNFKGGINTITITKTTIDTLKNLDSAKFDKITKIVKINNPINIRINYEASIDKGLLNIKQYSIDFTNNIGISYGAKIKNVDFKGLKGVSEELNKNPKNFAVLANLMSKLMQLKIENFNLSIHNYGLIDRILDNVAKQKNESKQDIVNLLLKKIKTAPIESAYPSLKNFLTSKSKNLSVSIKNTQELSVGDIMSKMKNKEDILKILQIKFYN